MTRERIEDLGRILEKIKFAMDSPVLHLAPDHPLLDDNRTLLNELNDLNITLTEIYEIASGQDFLNETRSV